MASVRCLTSERSSSSAGRETDSRSWYAEGSRQRCSLLDPSTVGSALGLCGCACLGQRGVKHLLERSHIGLEITEALGDLIRCGISTHNVGGAQANCLSEYVIEIGRNVLKLSENATNIGFEIVCIATPLDERLASLL